MEKIVLNVMLFIFRMKIRIFLMYYLFKSMVQEYYQPLVKGNLKGIARLTALIKS